MTTAAVSMETLVQRAQGGDRSAFAEVYRRSVDRIYGLCLRMTADPDRAAELTQDAFVRAWERLDSFRGDSRFSTWMHRLAVNVVLQERRTRAGRERWVEPTPDVERYAAQARGAFTETRIDLERALATLPERAREALVLRDIEGFKYREVAVMTGVAVGTVKAQVHRARQLLKEVLER
ncbi:MAG: sigma-70 family RNA polymerase sigma factor [Gemmatimonadota bacterium]